ncbi:hypothetical protein F511_21253 [Dorcoceras hygrometricum]|uniref:Uncharacterized protein n=1 Tax=Dorcoceras hygrometricum TaxID=472368 RepID=A0A2Z7DFB5_9LAMI|nr:hypothetical protein F511_21253 [Dorcoceras hygrometricum]
MEEQSVKELTKISIRINGLSISGLRIIPWNLFNESEELNSRKPGQLHDQLVTWETWTTNRQENKPSPGGTLGSNPNNNTIKASHNSNEAYTTASIITHAQSKAVKQAHIRTLILLSYNYHKEIQSNTDPTPAKPNTDTSSRTVAQKLRIGSYELNQVCPTLLTQQKALNKAQVSRGNRHFTVDCGRLRQSGPRPETRLLRQPALEGLKRSARTDSPRQDWPEQFPAREAAASAATSGGGGDGFVRGGKGAATSSRTLQNPLRLLNTLSGVSVRESRIQYLCDPQWFRDTASRGSTTIVAPKSQFRICPTDHDSIGYPRMSASGESSTTMHRLLHASGSHTIPPPDDPKTNQYNQDLGLIHSTNGNHLESPNEGSSIDHQVTIYLHAQNITMFPTNETRYFASQILVSNSGGLILILTAQSTRNMFRIHSDY